MIHYGKYFRVLLKFLTLCKSDLRFVDVASGEAKLICKNDYSS